MKFTYVLVSVILMACSQDKDSAAADNSDFIEHNIDSAREGQAGFPVAKRYFNTRFRNVTVEKIGSDQFNIQGEAQIFEANFSWVVEDGHQELKRGFEMTDAGAPEWGNFKFTIEVEKPRPNSTLILILFESSAKDGTRQYELPVVLQ